jgi:cytochrome c1
MNAKLAKILSGLLGAFFLAAVFIYYMNHGFALPEPVTHARKEEPKPQAWSFEGPLGTFDRQSIQRGYKIYKEVCSSCHSMNLVSFRNLKGAGFSDAEIKSLAAEYSYPEIKEDGSTADRKGLPSDHFKAPYESKEAAAAANGGAVPPDLSLMAKAREDAPNYIYSILTGYGKTADYKCSSFDGTGNCAGYQLADDNDRALFAEGEKKRQEILANAEKENAELKKANKEAKPMPAFRKDSERPDAIHACIPSSGGENANPPLTRKECSRLPAGKYYNPYYPGQVIAMPPPLKDGQVDYEDGTKNDLNQEARDVVNFLHYTAEPEMELRKRMGLKVIVFLSVMTVFFYIAKLRIWARVS